MNRAAGIIGGLTFLSRILGLVRDMVVAGLFGSGMAADAFFVAFRIPNLLRRLFAEGSLTIAFIPVFTEYLATRRREDAFELARIVLTILSLVLAAVTLAGILFAPWIVRVQAFGFGASGAKYELTVLLTRITFPYIFLISIVAFFMGVLNSLRHFAAPAAAPIFLNVGIIAGAYLISPHCGEPIVGMAVGVLIGGILQVALQVPWALREGFRLAPRWFPSHPAVVRIGRLMLPAVFGAAVYQLNQFVGTLLATFLPEGSVSWLYYADRLVQFPLGVFAITVSTVALPSLSTQAATRDLDMFARTLRHALRLVFFVTIPSMVGLMILGTPLIRLLFERGAFDVHATVMTARALFYYLLGLWAYSGIRVVVSSFYALQDTKTPVAVAAVALAANIMFSLLLMGPLKHGGLALSLTLASSVQFCLLVVCLRRKLPGMDLGPVLVGTAKSVAAALVMGAAVYCLRELWVTGGSGVVRLVAGMSGSVGLGAAVYFGVARVLGCEELASVKDMLGPLLRKVGVRRKGK